MLRCWLRMLLVVALVAAGQSVRAADTPFYQAFQAPNPNTGIGLGTTTANSPTVIDDPNWPPTTPFGTTTSQSVGQPIVVPDNFVGATIVDQPLLTPIAQPTSSFDNMLENFGLKGNPNLLMPWQFGPAACTDCQTHSGYFFHNYSSWRGYADGTGPNNNGFSYGFNWATKLGPVSDYTGIGFQFGGSYGLYDLNGRASGYHDARIQQQMFLTAGLYRPADRYTNFSFGVVWDGMFNTAFGQYATSPFLSQIRGQIAYALNEQHEIGVWAAVRVNTYTTTVPLAGSVSYRGVDQINFFYHHRFGFGGTLTAPLSPRFGAFTSLQYMAPSAKAGAAASIDETFYITAGVAFYPYANSRASNVAGNCWMPYMPVANDGTFMVDSNKTF